MGLYLFTPPLGIFNTILLKGISGLIKNGKRNSKTWDHSVRVFNYHHGFAPTLRFSLTSIVSGIVPLTLYFDSLNSPFSLVHFFERKYNTSNSLTYCVPEILFSDSHNSPSILWWQFLFFLKFFLKFFYFFVFF